MRKITVTGNETIRIGRTGENRAVQVIWPGLLEKWRELYGDGTVQLAARRPKDTAPYPVVCEVRENDVMWTVQAADTAQYGIGECELTYLVGEVVAKSQTWATEIFRGLTYEETIEPPDDPAKTWFIEIRKEIGNLDHLETEGKTNLVSAINEAAQSGGKDGGYYAPSVDSGGNLTWTASKAGMPQVSGANIKGPKGDTGQQGPAGADGGKGVGIASIARTSGTGAAGTTDTYTITLTDGSTSTFTVYNGKDGASGSGSSTVTSVNGKTGDVKLPVSGFGSCATAAATAIKVVDGLSEDFLVEDGVQLCVKFSNANTAAAPQLSVAGASAPIFDARTSNNVDAAGIGARTHHFVYFSGIWVLLDAIQIIDAISIPDKLPNPNALTFTGAVTGSYDGSEPMTVEIPSGGSGGSAEPGYKDAITLLNVTLDDETGGLKNYEYDVSGIEKTDVIIINILFPESYSGNISIRNQSGLKLADEFPNGAKGIVVGIKAMNGRYLHSAASSSNVAARIDAPLSLFYGQLNGNSGFERPKANNVITKIKFALSAPFASGTKIRIYRW